MEPQEKQQQELDTRVGRLEGAVESLSHQVEETSRTIKVLADGFGTFQTQVVSELGKVRTEVVRSAQETNAPKWPLIGWAVATTIIVLGLCGGIIGLILSGTSDRLTQVEIAQSAVYEYRLQEAHTSGKNEAAFEHLTNKMDVLDENTASKIVVLNSYMIKEFDKWSSRIGGLDGDIEEIKDWKLSHSFDSGVKSARLDALERRVYKNGLP